GGWTTATRVSIDKSGGVHASAFSLGASVHPRTAAAWARLRKRLRALPSGESHPGLGRSLTAHHRAAELGNDLCRCRRLPRPSPCAGEEQKTSSQTGRRPGPQPRLVARRQIARPGEEPTYGADAKTAETHGRDTPSQARA